MAGRRCLACHHPQRASIDRALLDGESLRVVAHLYGMDHSSIFRHKEKHLTARVVAVREQQAVKLKAEALDWLGEVRAARELARANYQWAKTEGDPPDANGAVATLLRSAELEARGTGAFAKAEAAAWAAYGLPSEAALKAAAAGYLDSQSADEHGLFSRALRLVAAYLLRHPGERSAALEAIGGVRVSAQEVGHENGQDGA